MIIYGYRHRNISLGSGEFQCPRCQMPRTYEYINVVRYFTLFFIALFPLGRLSSYIECQTCRTAFKPEELIGSPGNEVFARELRARDAAAEMKTKQKRGCATAVIGTIMGVVGGLALMVLVAFQLFGESDPTNNLAGFFGLMCICPLPLLLAGMGLLVWGVRIRQRASEDAIARGMTPMV